MVGKFVKIISPLTIVPAVSLVGITLFEHAAETASKNWFIAVRYIFIVIDAQKSSKIEKKFPFTAPQYFSSSFLKFSLMLKYQE